MAVLESHFVVVPGNLSVAVLESHFVAVFPVVVGPASRLPVPATSAQTRYVAEIPSAALLLAAAAGSVAVSGILSVETSSEVESPIL